MSRSRLDAKDRARLLGVILHALAPPALMAWLLWSQFDSPEAQGWRLDALRLIAGLGLAGSVWIAYVSARAWVRKDGKALRKGYGIICDEPGFWIRALGLPPNYFDPPALELASEAPDEQPLWTEIEPEEASLAKARKPDPSATPIQPKSKPRSDPR